MKTTSLTPNISKSIKIPKRNDERIVLHFDYDCFYASVFENENPSLKSQPLGIKQKSILATCNYVARARGVKKLMLISEAQKICPDLILMNGEDLTRFRDVSKRLWSFLRAHSWNDRVERLGLDEVFLDVTDVVAYNREMLNVHALENSFFHLDRNDPVKGFAFDGSRFYGCVQPSPPTDAKKTDGAVEVIIENPLCVGLMLASHLAGYLRHRFDEDFGYTSSGGIATNKVLAKLAGSVNKPNNQTTLLTTNNGAVEAFMDAHIIRKIPGIGSRIAQLIEEYLLSRPSRRRDREGEDSVTVGEVRRHPDMSSELLEQILDRPGAERGSGEKVWNLLHGVDASEVKEASDVPTQISIEDTYMSRPLQTPAEVTRELRALATSLIRRMRVDLTEADANLLASSNAGQATPNPTDSSSSSDTIDPSPPRWLAYPKTLRLSTRTKPKSNIPPGTSAEASAFSRSSRSAPLPSFVFTFNTSCEEIAERLVAETLLPLFRRLHPERGGGWNLALLNICLANMVVVASETSGVAGGRDIGRMFQTQKDKLRQWTVYDTSPSPLPPVSTESNSSRISDTLETPVDGDPAKNLVKEDRQGLEDVARSSSPIFGEGDDDVWENQESDSQRCEICGHAVPAFAISAHERFHAMDE